MCVRKNGVGICGIITGTERGCASHCSGLQVKGSQWIDIGGKTYVKNTKDPVKFQPPCSNPTFILLCTEKARDRISFALFNNIPLNLNDGSVIETLLSESCHVSHRQFNSRCQLFNRLGYWPTQRIHFSALHLRFERPTYTGTGQPQFNIIKPVDHRVLCTSAGG